MDAAGSDLLHRIEAYYDAAPRPYARVEEVGPFTLFVGRTWPFYARPRRGGGRFDGPAVERVLSRMRDLGVPLALEWVGDVTPDLLEAVRADGTLAVTEIPLMVHRGPISPAAALGDITVRMLGRSDAAALRDATAAQALAFGPPCAAPADVAERDGARRAPSAEAIALLEAGRMRAAVAEHPSDGVLATGRHIVAGTVSEIVGVATLPARQGRGLGSAVTNALLADAERCGVDVVFLTASDERVAELYGRLGFVRVGTGYVAEA